MKRVFYLSLICLFSISCASTGNMALKDETSESLDAKLSQGMTKGEVRSLLGDPVSKNFTDSGAEIWRYEYTYQEITAQTLIPIVSLFSSGTKGTSKELIILFDIEDRVKKYSMSESDVGSETGIFQ